MSTATDYVNNGDSSLRREQPRLRHGGGVLLDTIGTVPIEDTNEILMNTAAEEGLTEQDKVTGEGSETTTTPGKDRNATDEDRGARWWPSPKTLILGTWGIASLHGMYRDTLSCGRSQHWDFEHPGIGTDHAARTGVFGLVDIPVNAVLDLFKPRGEIVVECNPSLPSCDTTESGLPYVSSFQVRSGEAYALRKTDLNEDGEEMVEDFVIYHDGPMSKKSFVRLPTGNDTHGIVVFREDPKQQNDKHTFDHSSGRISRIPQSDANRSTTESAEKQGGGREVAQIPSRNDADTDARF